MSLINFEINNYYTNNSHQMTNFLVDGLSYCNDYIPFYSAWVNKGVYNRESIHYSIPSFCYNVGRPIKRYSDLMRQLENGSTPIEFKTAAMNKPIYIMKGLIFELDDDGEANILFLLAVKSDQMFGLNREHIESEKYAMFITPNFMTGQFKNVYKKLYKEVFEDIQTSGVDTIITSDIRKWCYKNDVEFPSFSTIAERKAYLQTFNSELFYEQQ